MFDKNVFSERLKELRLSKNMTQQQLSNVAGIMQGSIARIEKKERAVSIEVLYAIAENLDISTDWLLGLSDIKERR